MNSDKIIILITSLPEEGKTGNEYRVIESTDTELNDSMNTGSFDRYINLEIPNYTKKFSKALTVAAAISRKNEINTIKLLTINQVFPRYVSESSQDKSE